MAYRNIFIANTASLSTRNEQLIVENGEHFSFPIEDIRCVLLDDCKSTISAALISKLAQAGVTLIVCNSKHIPSAALSPINCYSRQLKQLRLQIAQTQPAGKRIWQQIVTAKIKNQAKCLELMSRDGSDKLMNYAGSVQSGDPSNVEGRAASAYFRFLFGKDFRRDDDTPITAALNYGYAIIRAIISRTVCLYGFSPELGIHHCSELNNFNLSDDIIEPYRPFVDLVVAKSLSDCTEFGTADKAMLLKSINAAIKIGGEKHSVAFAIEKTIQSYASVLKKETKQLLLPDLIGFEFSDYE